MTELRKVVTLYRVFHGIRFILRLVKIACREISNFCLYLILYIKAFRSSFTLFANTFIYRHIEYIVNKTKYPPQLTPRLELRLHLVWRKTYTSFQASFIPRLKNNLHLVWVLMDTSCRVPYTRGNEFNGHLIVSPMDMR